MTQIILIILSGCILMAILGYRQARLDEELADCPYCDMLD